MTKKHVFYLHGRIVELQGKTAVHPQFGKYDYDAIIDSLSRDEVIVHNTIRDTITSFIDYGTRFSKQIDLLINQGVLAKDITLVGASKGAVMAMFISDLNTHPINYVLIGANNSHLEEQNDWQLHGRVLAIIEKSDQLAGKGFEYWKARSPEVLVIREHLINTGLGHGFLYKPYEEWLIPTHNWIFEKNRKL